MELPHEVLVVEGDDRVRSLVRASLADEGLRVTETVTGSEALDAMRQRPIDVAIVELALPDMAGLDVVRDLRALAPDVHIVIVSGSSSDDERVQGFAAGADDHVTKPCSAAELTARVRAGLRRRADASEGILVFDSLTVDLGARRVQVAGEEVDLPRLEFDLLAHLVLSPGHTFSRERLLRDVWGSSSNFQLPATVTEHVRRLRQKLDGDGIRDVGCWITTVRGAGYRFDPRPVRSESLLPTEAPGLEVALRSRPALAAAAGQHLQSALIGIRTEVADAVVITTPDLVVRAFNPAAEALYGRREEQVRGRLVREVIPWEGTADELADATRLLRERGGWAGEVEQRHLDGTTFRVRATVTVLRDDEGKVLGVIAVNRKVRPEATAASAPATHGLRYDDIVQSLERSTFIPYFQPIVRMHDDTVVGIEALARWEGPDGVVLEPSAFLPEAERSGLIVPLGIAILEQACREAAIWHAAGSTAHLAANVSARQLGDSSIVTLVASMLARHDLPASALWLEVTETSLIDDIDGASAVLGALAELGVNLSVDDFGTGWASLTYLRRFPIKGIKVDRSFVAGLGTATSDQAIVRSILRLGRDLGLVVVAEGVETNQQRRALRALGCNLAQGYLYSRPVPAAMLHQLLAEPLVPNVEPDVELVPG